MSNTNPEQQPRRRRGALVGERNPSSVLTATQVLELRRARAEGASIRSLARRYGVARRTVRRASLGQTWRHLPLDGEEVSS